ncbi:hypothetical protein C4588_05645 [Candidatus Parcubacteria bacterium]|nr:MAG: hypothetical protein C4588_05645 [Candidatus Parcubacteria bacterium]
MTYSNKLESVRTIIKEHNTHVDEKSKIDVEAFLQRLKASGGTTDEALKLCKWEDIEKLQVPLLLARQIATVFRAEEKNQEKPKYITEKKAALLNSRELLQALDPKQTDSAVAKRLITLSKGQPILVYREDGSLNQEASLECLEDILSGYEARTVYLQDGVPVRVYRVGQLLETTVNENPLFPGHPLRGANDVCHNTHRSWKDVPQKARILLHLALKNRELLIDQFGTVHDILDRFVDKDSAEIVKWAMARYPQAALRYSELEASGNLPSLRIVRGATKPRQDPFFGNKTY